MSKTFLPFTKYDHTMMIRPIAKGLHLAGRFDNYLELGVRNGANFKAIAPFAKKSYAVDIDSRSEEFIKDVPNKEWHCCTTTEFLTQTMKGKSEFFDMVFIDADHSFEASKEDFDNAFPLVKDNGFILLHDIWPPNEECLHEKYCHDTYKTAIYIKENYLDRGEYVSFPYYYGVGVFRKTTKHLNWRTDSD